MIFNFQMKIWHEIKGAAEYLFLFYVTNVTYFNPKY